MSTPSKLRSDTSIRPENIQARNSALRGAVSAAAILDQRKAGSNIPATSPSNGAYRAAFKAGQPSTASHDTSQNLNRSRQATLESLRASATAFSPPPPPLLPTPSTSASQTRSVSPSNIAAQVAASRKSPVTLKPVLSNRDLNKVRALQQSHVLQPQLEEQDILPPVGTVSEVKKWLQSLEMEGDTSRTEENSTPNIEQAQSNQSELQKPRLHAINTNIAPLKSASRDTNTLSVRNAQDQIEEIHSPKPLRVSSGVFSPSTANDESLEENNIVQGLETAEADVRRNLGATGERATQQKESQKRSSSISTTDSRRESFSTAIDSPRSLRTTASLRRSSSKKTTNESSPKPRPPPPRKSSRVVAPFTSSSDPKLQRAFSTASTSSMQKTSVIKPRDPSSSKALTSSPVTNRQTQVSNNSLGRTSRAETVKDPANHIDGIANAIVAGHLASERSSSPYKQSAPTPTRKYSGMLHVPFLHSKHEQKETPSRTPSPLKQNKYTMRQDPSSSSSDDAQTPRKHKKILGIRKHPHKHHEGTRKRWRDTITEREKKRYDGVWAANRGLFVDLNEHERRFNPNPNAEPDSTAVSNLVVREIWRRSRLPETVLEEIWDLVDRSGIGRLDRDEFVVGMWLVDQVLKGRKLPTRVGESVWQSIRGVGGLRIPSYKA